MNSVQDGQEFGFGETGSKGFGVSLIEAQAMLVEVDQEAFDFIVSQGRRS